jgi:4-amino-4-deoxy-L-arabinose transferase-like glycosyltransferase
VALALWGAACLLALAAQAHVTTPTTAGIWRVLYLVATLVGLVGTLLIERYAPLPGPVGGLAPAAEAVSDPAHRWLGAGLLMGGSVLALSAVVWLLVPSYAPATWSWLLGMALALAGAAISDGLPRRLAVPRRSSERADRVTGLLLASIVLLALALRLPNLEAIPPDVHGDEAAIGLEARRQISGEVRDIFGVGWFDVPNLSFAIPAVVMRVAGDDLFGLRLASVLQGVLSVVLLYLLAGRLFGVRVALLAAFLLAVAAWHIHFSRTGFHYMQATLATVLLLYLLVRALQTGCRLDFLATGLAAGLCVGVYYAARLAPLLAALYLAYLAMRDRAFLGRHRTGLALLVLGGVLFVAPMGVVVARHPGAFTSRTTGVLLTTPDNLAHQLDAYHVGTVREVLAIQTRRTLEAFNVSGASALQYSPRGPLLDTWTGALFVLGVAAYGFRVRQPRYFLLGSWLWLTLVVGIIPTTDAPSSPRMAGILPAVALFPALVLDTGWRGAAVLFGRVGRQAAIAIVGVSLALAAAANWRDYFEVYVRQPVGIHVVTAMTLRDLGDHYRVYLVSRATSVGYETERFLTPNTDGVDVRGRLDLPVPPPPAGKGLAFLFDRGVPDAADQLARVKQAYPNGREEAHTSPNGEPLLVAYLVDRP